MNKIIALPAALVLLGLAACGTAAPAAEAQVAAPALTTPAPVETPATTVAPAPAPAPAPVETVAPTTAAPAPAPAPVEVEVNIQNEGTDVVVPEGPVVVATPAPVNVTPPPPVIVAPSPPPAVYDPSRIAPGVIEDGVHYGYLYDWEGWEFSFDRVDVAADGTWSNTNAKLRTLPYSGPWLTWAEGWDVHDFWSGQELEVHVENQRVVAVYVIEATIGSQCGC